jgi:tight adherence protein B
MTKGRWLSALVAGMLLLLVGAAPAGAATVATIRKVDTTAFPTVKVVAQVSGATPTLDQFQVRDGDQLVSGLRVVPLGETATPVGVVLVIDTSGSMRDLNKIEQARAAAKQFVAQKGPNTEIAVVAFSQQARVVINFTKDTALLNGGIDKLSANGETSLWDAVRMASGLFRERPGLQANMVVLSDGADTTSQSNAAEARSSAVGSNAAVYALGLVGGKEFDAGNLQSLASASGGRYIETGNPAALGQLYGEVQQAIKNQYELSWKSSAPKVVDVTLSVAGATTKASAPIGGASQGPATNQPKLIAKSAMPSFLQGGVGKFLIALLALVAAGLLAYGVLLLVVRTEQSTLQSALRPYSEEGVEPEAVTRNEVSMAESALVRRAVAATGRIASERGVLEYLERRLEQADLPLRAPEALFFSLVAGLFFIVLAGIFGHWVGLLLGILVVGLGPVSLLNLMAARRRRKFASQLPDMLQLLAGSLRAGYSLLQGVDAVAQEVDDPMGQELRRVLAEARLGRPLEEALDDAAERMGSADFSWAVMAVGIQREVGGNLAELLDTVAETMIQRVRLRREVRALTAEGRVSAIILGIMPIALGLMMYVVNQEYIAKLFNTGVGQAMLGASSLLAIAGFIWMQKIVDIEI